MRATLSKSIEWLRVYRSGLFDAEYYLTSNPDVLAAKIDPLKHFLNHGWKEGRSPSPRFDLPRYIEDNPDVRYLNINPVVDWLTNSTRHRRVSPRPVGSSAYKFSSDKRIIECYELIRNSHLFDYEYYLSTYPDLGSVLTKGVDGIWDALHHYIGWGHIENRNPSPLFDTQFYTSQYGHMFIHDTGPARALMHYIRVGQGMGLLPRPQHSFILDTKPVHLDFSHRRIAIHFHAYYPEYAEDILNYLSEQKFSFDLYISVTCDVDRNFVEKIISRRSSKMQPTISVVENRGRDIAPFLTFLAKSGSNYDYICHLHSKRSPHTTFGDQWFKWIMGHLFGTDDHGAQLIRHMEEHPKCGMLFPDSFYLVKQFANWGGNEERILAILARLGFKERDLRGFPLFSAGSMGWFRVEALKALIDKPFELEDFEEEAGQEEGTLAHALERALPQIAKAAGYDSHRFYLSALPPHRQDVYEYPRLTFADPVGLRWLRDTPAIASNKATKSLPLSNVFNPGGLEINWVIPDFSLGAGGHMTIFRIVELLEKFGHRQTVWIQNARNHPTPSAAKAAIRRYYRPIGARVGVRFLPDDVRELGGDVAIATDCWTVFPVRTAPNVKQRFYFIQDFEPSFHPVGDNYLIAESTYKMGLAALCAGEWLLRKAQNYGMWARKWDLASDPEFYYPKPDIGITRPRRPLREKRKIAFYCRSYTARRAVNLGLAAFQELARRRNDFEVVFFGEDPRTRDVSFTFQDLGVLAPRQLGELYRDCDLGIAFSTTNMSLVPLEMMACRLPVIEIDTDSTRVAYNDGSVVLAPVDPAGIADSIERILDDDETRNAVLAKADAFVSAFDWERSARMIEDALIERLVEQSFKPIAPAQIASPVIHSRRKCSVVIPTYNGGARFREVLKRVANQVCDFEYDILVVDSSSTDGTHEFAVSFGKDVRGHVIPKEDFQHGRTRNLAIDMTEGEFVAILTQDATPADTCWLQNLVSAFGEDQLSAGVFGRHVAYPHHNAFTGRDLKQMFDRFYDLGPIFNLDRGLPGFLPRSSRDWRMMMHFYSDNNSAIRRSVWRELPYPEVSWGEDQVWAWEALQLGFSKIYAHNAVVFHSHDLDRAAQFKVGVEEGEMFARYFGYDLHGDFVSEDHFLQLTARERAYALSKGILQSQVDAYIASYRSIVHGRIVGRNNAGRNGGDV